MAGRHLFLIVASWRLLGAATLVAGLAGCLQSPWADAIIYQSLDYRIDRPRILAINAIPPLFEGGRPVELEAFALGPKGETTKEALWKTCGLDEDQWISLYSLDCFREEDRVQEIAKGNPTVWTPPVLDFPCDQDAFNECVSAVPVVLELEMEEQLVRGSFEARILGPDAAIQTNVPLTLSAADLELTVGSITGNEVDLIARIGLGVDFDPVFRWYVDDGTLLETGRTAAMEGDLFHTRSENRWILPDRGGPWRVAVVVSAFDGLYSKDQEDSTVFSGPNMAWDLIVVEEPR